MNQKTRGIIYSVMAAVILIGGFILLWQLLGNKTTQISEPVFRENIAQYEKISVNIYSVTCVDGNGAKYTFVTLDRAELNKFIQEQWEKEGGVNPKLKESDKRGNPNYSVSDPNAVRWTDFIMPVGGILLTILLVVFLYRQIATEQSEYRFRTFTRKSGTKYQSTFCRRCGSGRRKRRIAGNYRFPQRS